MDRLLDHARTGPLYGCANEILGLTGPSNKEPG